MGTIQLYGENEQKVLETTYKTGLITFNHNSPIDLVVLTHVLVEIPLMDKNSDFVQSLSNQLLALRGKPIFKTILIYSDTIQQEICQELYLSSIEIPTSGDYPLFRFTLQEEKGAN